MTPTTPTTSMTPGDNRRDPCDPCDPCDPIDGQLVAFHFGVLDEPARSEVETHLLACAACVRSFIAVKRAIESEAGLARPSETSRQRLRRAVAAEVGGARMKRRFVYPALAAAAMVVVALGVGLGMRGGRGHGAPPATEARSMDAVDSARVIPANLDYL